MRGTQLLIALLLLGAAGGTVAGGVSLGEIPACDVTFTTADSLDRINNELNGSDADRTFCFAPGNYTGKGTIQLKANGSQNSKRWVRLAGSGTTHPVRLDPAQRATLKALAVTGDWWVVHRLAFDSNYSTSVQSGFESSAQDVVVDRALFERGGRVSAMVKVSGAQRITIQNSVLRNTRKVPKEDLACISFGNTSRDVQIVRNEIYNCAGDSVIVNKNAAAPGLLIEDNDLYLTSAYYSGSDRACAENAIDLKGGGLETNPVVITGNRIWGFRKSDTSCATTGSSGEAINIHEDGTSNTDWVLVHNNVIMDSPRGVSCPTGGSDNVSIIGNLFYNIHSSYGSYAIDLLKFNRAEVYFNTVVNAQDYWLQLGGTNLDVRCNVVVNGRRETGSKGSNTTVGYNAFYNTQPFHTEGSGTNVVHSTAAEALAEAYPLEIKRWTGKQTVKIPYAVPSQSSPHFRACGISIGTVSGIGLDETVF